MPTLPPSFSTDGFIQEKIRVEEPDASRTFGKSARPAAFSPASGSIVLIGLPGSGRRELANALSVRLGMGIAAPEEVNAAMFAPGGIYAEPGRIVVLPCEALREESVRVAVHKAGTVFYLMAEVLRMAHRLGKTSDADREALSALFVEMEPLCMQTLHYILQAWKEPEDLVENVLEMLGLPTC